MARVYPHPSRVQVSREPGRIRLSVRVRRNWLVIPFLSAWLGGWAFGEVMVARQLLSGRTPLGASAFMLFWLAAWTAGGAFAIVSLLWTVAGREVITVDGRTLAIRHSVAGLGRSREFDLASVQNLRAEPTTGFDLYRFGRTPFPTMRTGAVAFDYGARTYRLGSTLDGQDVQVVLDAIRERLPASTSSF